MAGQKRHSRDTLWFYQFLLNAVIRDLQRTPREKTLAAKLERVQKYLAYQQASRKENAKLGGAPTPEELEGWQEAVDSFWHQEVARGTCVSRARRLALQSGIYVKLSKALDVVPHRESVFRRLRALNNERKKATKP